MDLRVVLLGTRTSSSGMSAERETLVCRAMTFWRQTRKRVPAFASLQDVPLLLRVFLKERKGRGWRVDSISVFCKAIGGSNCADFQTVIEFAICVILSLRRDNGACLMNTYSFLNLHNHYSRIRLISDNSFSPSTSGTSDFRKAVRAPPFRAHSIVYKEQPCRIVFFLYP